LLSWVEPQAQGNALRFSRFVAGAWSTAVTIAAGDDYFGNPSDTPHVRATPDGALWAAWLRASPAGGHAADIVLTRSGDGGASWSTPVLVNTDGTQTEHGFVAMWPAAKDRMGLAWLDGRATVEVPAHGHEHAQHGHGDSGMTMLRAASFDVTLARSEEIAVDTSACDCCQTDVAGTSSGPLVVYRDRTSAEIRDIATVRLHEGAWSQPRIVHADGWKMSACPVNGPAISSEGANVAAAWYTAAGGVPSVRFALSGDAGEHFAAPLEIDRSAAVLGAVDLALAADSAWLTWLREEPDGQSLWLARIARDGSREEQRLKLASLSGRGRATGLPKLALLDGRLHAVWTDVENSLPRLRGATIQLQ
jgi:hypothetical protein